MGLSVKHGVALNNKEPLSVQSSYFEDIAHFVSLEGLNQIDAK
jgi:hypothetical protein